MGSSEGKPTPSKGSATGDKRCVCSHAPEQHGPSGCSVMGWSSESCDCKYDGRRLPGVPRSATPDGKPSAREVAEAAVTKWWGDGPFPMHLHIQLAGLADVVTVAIEQDRATRDALHAETLRAALASRAADRELIAVRAALQHGEERERLMREALERLGSALGALVYAADLLSAQCQCMPCEADRENGPRFQRAIDNARGALDATAQAMKEAAK